MPVRLKYYTTLALAVLYLVVGLSGATLHYLVDDSLGRQRSATLHPRDGDVATFAHAHGPDYHVHFHRAPVGRPSERDVAAQGEDRSVDCRFFGHVEHACPLLTLLSTLRLGSGGAATLHMDLGARHTWLKEARSRFDAADLSLQQARGPPLVG